MVAYRIGIDAGSKTIKVVVLDEEGNAVVQESQRHRFNIGSTLQDMLHTILYRHGNFAGTICITGSAGIGLAQALNFPFVQEVVATTRAVKEQYPQANAIIELGGEDAKVVYLDEPVEQRMNATCAGGTGGFIDTIAHLIGSRTKQFSHLSMGAMHIYPIASRCAVFAQTDVRPLLNAGVSKMDIAASTLESVIRQTIGGLACGRPITGTVVFLGGPFEYIEDLSVRFRRALDLTNETGIKPRSANLFTARGAALIGGDGTGAAIAKTCTTSLALLELACQQLNLEDDLEHLPPLFDSDQEREDFIASHQHERMPQMFIYDCQPPLYLGIDAGSTAVKAVVIDSKKRLVMSEIAPCDGDVLATASKLVHKITAAVEHNIYRANPMRIAHATATGYGEDLLIAALGVDSGVVETIAHATAAQLFDPQCSFLLDIGGQDMKAIWIRDGMVQNAVLNEACSSGCGAFVAGTAHTLACSPASFAERALLAPDPVDLGTKCTVFMNSRVRHAQKVGASVEDLSAGIAYSVIKNALFRIIGLRNLDSLGDHIVVQGGTFLSNAILRAFEKISGKHAVRPAEAQLMGAIGAALIAMQRAEALPEDTCSTLIPPAEMKGITAERKAHICPGCPNTCVVTSLDFGNGRGHLSGNRCSRAYEALADVLPQSVTAGAPSGSGPRGASGSNGSIPREDAASTNALPPTAPRRARTAPPNAIKAKQALLAAFQNSQGDAGTLANASLPLHGHTIGLPATLRAFDQTPFWHQLLTSLGARVLVAGKPERLLNSRAQEGAATIPSESVCYPAKLVHDRIYDLHKAGADAILLPRVTRNRRCAVSCSYSGAAIESIPLFQAGLVALSPLMETHKPWEHDEDSVDYQAVYQALCQLGPVDADLFAHAWDAAQEAQRTYREANLRANERALEWAREPGHAGIVLAGRPYHADPALLHSIDQLLVDLGFAVIDAESLTVPRTKEACAWGPAKHLARMARFVVGEPNLSIVLLQSFGCQYDGLSLPRAQDILTQSNKPFATLKIDEMFDVAHIRIRLRTLAETIEQRRLMHATEALAADTQSAAATQIALDTQVGKRPSGDPAAAQKTEAPGSPDPLTAEFQTDAAGSHTRDAATDAVIQARTNNKTADASTKTPGSRVNRQAGSGIVSSPTDITGSQAGAIAGISSGAANPQANEPRPASGQSAERNISASSPYWYAQPSRDDLPQPPDAFAELSPEHVQIARLYNQDLCYVAAAITGRAIEQLTRQPHLKELVIPAVCKGCVLDGLPDIVTRAHGFCPPVTWTDNFPWHVASCHTHAQNTREDAEASGAHPSVTVQAAAPNRPLVGIVGAAPLCYEPQLNDHIVDLITRLGCTPVLPNPQLIAVDDVRYLDQLDAFAAQGVSQVIYLQSFGCIKGHVQSRGALKSLARRYPHMPITVIDYDCEASALNRENRIRLALAGM